ncbi:MAG: tetratricopeptide repeat protein [Blastochloris sp.]|nr:tetratricopeptide repeat protein [Blastochloris sp.]
MRTLPCARFSGYTKTMGRIAAHYMQQGQWSLAFDTAFAAEDQALAQQILAMSGEQQYTNGHLETLKHWFAAIPTAELSTTLLCLKARMALDQGAIQEAQMLTQMAELQMQPDDRPQVQLLQAHLARKGGQYEHALEIVDAVLAHTNDIEYQATALRVKGICHHRLGQTDVAITALNDALSLRGQQSDFYAIAQIKRDLGICYRDLGRLDVAERYYDQADAYWVSTGNAARRTMSLNSKGGIQHLQGRFQEAHTTMVNALQHARTAGLRAYEATILSCLGDLYSDLQLWDRATIAYTDARQIGGNAHLMGDLMIAQIQMLVRQSQYEHAARCLRQISKHLYTRRAATIRYLAGSIACGQGAVDQARDELQQLFDELDLRPSLMDKARAYLLQAQIAAADNDKIGLVQALDHAGQVAAQIGSDTFLIAETTHLRSMLRRAAAGWAPAHEWLQRQQDMTVSARLIEQDDQRPSLAIRTLGIDQILLDGQLVALGWAKAREVLYYLLAHSKGASIEDLCEVIWPDLVAERSREALRSAVYQLRSLLPRELIVLHRRQIYQIDRTVVRLEYDVERFEALFETLDERRDDQCEALFEAISLYRGSYLPTTDNTWSTALRTHLERRYLQALAMLAAHTERERDFDEAIVLYQRVLAMDAFDEAAHVGIMRCHVGRGNRAAAIQQYHTLRRLLDEELGLDLAADSDAERLYRRILDDC